MLEENNVTQIEEKAEEFVSMPVQSKPIKQSKPKYQKEICKVIWAKQNSYAVSFKGFGITIPTDHQINESEIEVKYVGAIGEPNFEVIS